MSCHVANNAKIVIVFKIIITIILIEYNEIINVLTSFPRVFCRFNLLLLNHEVFGMVDRLIVGVFHPDPK